MSGGPDISTLFFTVRDDTPLQELEAEIFEDAISKGMPPPVAAEVASQAAAQVIETRDETNRVEREIMERVVGYARRRRLNHMIGLVAAAVCGAIFGLVLARLFPG